MDIDRLVQTLTISELINYVAEAGDKLLDDLGDPSGWWQDYILRPAGKWREGFATDDVSTWNNDERNQLKQLVQFSKLLDKSCDQESFLAVFAEATKLVAPPRKTTVEEQVSGVSRFAYLAEFRDRVIPCLHRAFTPRDFGLCLLAKNPPDVTFAADTTNKARAYLNWIKAIGELDCESLQACSSIDPVVETESQLNNQSLLLFRFLVRRLHPTDYDTLRTDFWRKGISDSGIKTGIERLQQDLNGIEPQRFIVENQAAIKRVKLVKA